MIFRLLDKLGVAWLSLSHVLAWKICRILYDRLKTLAIGVPVKGRLIEYLSTAHPDWE